ncbi:MAG: DUF3320 domain-containing protein [Chloroflexi bacterium]|nr:DUF3320 domain-containing protein [Chloroflexota bacterium]
MDAIAEKLEASRRNLLDLGLRNPLINYRPLKAAGVEIAGEKPEELFRILTTAGMSMSFLAAPEKEQNDLRPMLEEWAAEDPSLEVLLKQPEEDETLAALRYFDSKLQTPYSSVELQKRLLNTFYTARTYLEERGINALYLALGMLQWVESNSNPLMRRAPLILVPMALERTDVNTRFRARYTEAGVEGNLSLQVKLKTEFNLDLPPLPEEDELDVPAYFQEVANAIRALPRWSVDPSAVALGFFSFGAFLMYRDLQPDLWPANGQPTRHPVLRALLSDGFREPPSTLDNEMNLDGYMAPPQSFQVVDADSSQLLALLDVMHGRNLVIQGPPGTGKSQTITNIIAGAIGQGKTVLFVAEKMAALEVVKRRLDHIGLGDACLELHSHKTSKKVLLDELQRTLELGRPKVENVLSDDKATLAYYQEHLSAYSAAVNTPIGRSGVTPYRAYGALLALTEKLQNVQAPQLDFRGTSQLSGEEFRQRLESVAALQTLLGRMGLPVRHPFWGSRYTVYSPANQRQLQQAAQSGLQAIAAVQRSAAVLAGHLGRPAPQTPTETEELLRAAQHVLNVPFLEGVHFRANAWLAQAEDILAAVQAGARIREHHYYFDEQLLPEAWQQNVLAIRQALAAYGRRWWRRLSGPYRQARDQLAGLCRYRPPRTVPEQLELVEAILEVQHLQPTLARHGPLFGQLFGQHWKGERSDWPYLLACAGWLVETYRLIQTRSLPEGVIEHVVTSLNRETLSKGIAGLTGDLAAHAAALETVIQQGQLDEVARFGRQGGLAGLPFVEQEQLLQTWHGQAGRLQEIVTFNHLANTLSQVELEKVVETAATWPEGPQHLVDLVQRAWYEGVLAMVLEERPGLAAFNSQVHRRHIQEFCQLDTNLLRLNRARLAHEHWQRLPRPAAGGQWGVLRRELAKKARHLPIRQLMLQAGHAIQAIKPVFMMSPLSAAMFLPPGALRFDLVIFDEASQVKPVDGFGAILRGNQAVVVGDRRQLPPTTFFSQITEGADEADNLPAEMESLLDLFVAQGAPQRMLLWHYRSRHESLITVSNQEFYDNRLVIFPSPGATGREMGVVYRHLPEAFYERGGNRTNPQEAQVVAQAVMEHARTRPDLTLGVAAFSVSQMQAILTQLEILRRQDSSCEPFFNAHPEEPFFVKNLENVQGDERDVIFISIGYGRSADGQVTMNFGPLNQSGGERRLNVLITRARRRCEVFTNLAAGDLDFSRTNARGVVALERYLRFAETGRLDSTQQAGPDGHSPFEEIVAVALRQAGYQVAHRVGQTGSFVDLAVIDESRPGRYLLGIICDGPGHHDTQSTRDRDRLRRQVLEGLGWRIHQTWSAAWFHSQEHERQRLIEAIQTAGEQPDGPSPAADPPASVLPVSPPVERHGTDPSAAAIRLAAEYTLAQPNFRLGRRSLGSIPPEQLAEWIKEVVEVESPVHIEEVVRRLTGAAGLKRIESYTRKAIHTAAAYARRKGLVEQQGEFLWKTGIVRLAPARDRANLPAAARKIERVAPEEIAEAVKIVVAASLGMEQPEIPRAVLRLLGLGPATMEKKKPVEAVISQMIKEQALVRRGDFLFVSR